MKRYLLDSTPLAGYLNRRPRFVALISPWITGREVATSPLVFAEVDEYIRGLSNYPIRHSELRDLLHAVPPLGLTYAALERYGEIRRKLRPPHGPGLIGDIDTLIAATALERGLTLVTTDSDFERVPELSVMLLPRR